MRNIVIAACLLLAGCSSMGPDTVPRDRFDYIASISESWKRQMLLNLLKVRYADAPVFLDVSSVVNSYTLEGTLNAYGQNSATGLGDTYRGLSATGRYADMPTITYTPLTGDKFAKSILSPIPLNAVLLLAQGGYPIDVVMRLSVRTMNGLVNSYGGYAGTAGDPRFHEVLNLLRQKHAAGGLDLRLRSEGEDKQEVVIAVRRGDPAIAEQQKRFAELLGLDPGAAEYRVTAGAAPASDKEIALQTRSMLQVLVELGSYIEVPPGDAAEGRVHVAQRSAEQLRMFPALLRAHHGNSPPRDAYVAVRYRERWFWIDDRDSGSKAGLSFLMLMFSLTDSDAAPTPVLTIPTR